MATSCDPNDLAALARCFKCLPGATLQEVQTFLLCQILNNGGTGGGGPGSFPVEPANTVFAGPTAGVPALPTFRAIVAADLGTTLDVTFNSVTVNRFGGGAGSAPSYTQTSSGQASNAAYGGILLQGTIATLNNQIFSPSIQLSGQGWNTGAAASQAVAFEEHVVPVQGNPPTGIWRLSKSINGAAFTGVFSVDSTGRVGVGLATPTDPLSISGTVSQMVTVAAQGVLEPYVLVTSTLFANYNLFGVRAANAFIQHGGGGAYFNVEGAGGGPGTINAAQYNAAGVAGFTGGPAVYTTFTFSGGICTNAV